MFRLTIAVGFVIFSFPVLSESLELNMNHLPSAQPSGVNNFTYNGFDLDKEEDYFSINGSKLIQAYLEFTFRNRRFYPFNAFRSNARQGLD